ncbi:MAG: alpha-galactosidase, partial [Acetatifactor sp.]|nr:alpha-galactosidase [Acetatifactor sp.]
MSIRQIKQAFLLETKHTSYIFHILDTGHMEHLYYGRRIHIGEQGQGLEALTEKRAFPQGNTNSYDSAHEDLTLENICLEMSSYGKGDIREPFVEVIHGDGSYTSDFLFREAVITGEKPEYRTLPGSYGGEGQVEHLCVTLEDKGYDLQLELHYYVYPHCDVIARSSRLVNYSETAIQVRRLMSMQLDLADTGYVMSTFTGAWAREMHRTDIPLRSGKTVNASYTGTTSSRANSFVMLSHRETGEDTGECMGFHLIYSGNHYEAAEVSPYGKTRLVTGINPQSLCWHLEPGQELEAPEAFFTWSGQGFNDMSGQLHAFIREHIVRGQWKNRQRPVLL